MRRVTCFIGAVLLAAITTFSSLAVDPEIAQHLQDISVTVDAGNATGSGVLITRTNAFGDTFNFVLTAAHVVENLRKDTKSEGKSKKPTTTFEDAHIVTFCVEDGTKVGRSAYDAKVIRYSDSEDGDDIALLELHKKNYSTNSTIFAGATIVKVGIPLLHVGSFRGERGANSVSDGLQSYVGRSIVGRDFDQTSVTALPGSSGGGVYTTNGVYVGMLVRGGSDNVNYYVPMRRIVKWAKRNHVTWVLDPSLPFPEDIGELIVEGEAKEKAPVIQFPFGYRIITATSPDGK